MSALRFPALLISALTCFPALAADRPPATPGSPNGVAAAQRNHEEALLGWWQFETFADAAVPDSSGKDHHATVLTDGSAGPLLDEGKIGKALRLDRSTSLRVVGFKGVATTAPRTVVTWIKTDSPSGTLVSWGADEPGKKWNFGFIRQRVGVTPKGGYLYMNEPTDDGDWHQVAVVVKETSAPNLHDDVALYLDGEPAVIHDIGLLDLWPIETGQELDVTIGGGFEGFIDDLRIYGRSLSEEEIEALFQSADGG